MVLLVTANNVLAQGLSALLNALADLPGVTVAKNAETALLVLDQGVVGLVILDGGLPFPALARLLAARAAATTFPPILLLMDGVDQAELARREQLTPILKGSPTAELILAIGALLAPSEVNPPTNG
jgi:DNA-binding NarL/FixJ family response regulator